MLLVLAAALAVAAPLRGGAAEPSTPPGVLQVYLVRHGQAFSNLDPAPKLPPHKLDRLTALGHEQASETGRVLALRQPALILTSPANRARETAEEIKQAARGVAVRTEPRVRPEEPGESPARVGARVLQAVREEHKRHGGRPIVVVAHSEVIGAFLALVQGEPAATAHPFPVRNGSVSLVELGDDGEPELVFTNRLPDELPPP
jgi:broad specificity phosphatase PhoE